MSLQLAQRADQRLAYELAKPAVRSSRQYVCPFCQCGPRRAQRKSQFGSQTRANVATKRLLHMETPLTRGDLTTSSKSSIASSKPSSLWIGKVMRAVSEASEAPAQESKRTSDPYGIAHYIYYKNTRKLVDAIQQAANHPEYMRSVPKTTWTEAFRVLQVEVDILPYHRVHRNWSTRVLTNSPFQFESKQQQAVGSILKTRQILQDAGVRLGLPEYRVILMLLGKLGNETFARSIWRSMKSENIIPDLECYNSFMRAIVYNEEARLNVTKGAINKAAADEGHQVKFKHWKNGQTPEITEIINEMSMRGIKGDAETYSYLLTVLARDNMYDEFRRLVVKLWGIDANDTTTDADLQKAQANSFRADSRRPTPHTLAVLVEALGYMGRIPAAVYVLRAISSQYNVKITEGVWYQLVRWAWNFKHFIPEQQHFKGSDDMLELILPQAALAKDDFSLLEGSEGMQSVKPSIDMLHYVMNTGAATDDSARSHFVLEHVDDFMESGARQYALLVDVHHKTVDLRRRSRPKNPRHAKAKRYNVETLARRILHRNFLRRFVSRLLQFTFGPVEADTVKAGQIVDETAVDLTSRDPIWQIKLEEWVLRRLPQFLDRWKEFTAPVIEYELPTGVVNIKFKALDKQQQLLHKPFPADTAPPGFRKPGKLGTIHDREDMNLVWRRSSNMNKTPRPLERSMGQRTYMDDPGLLMEDSQLRVDEQGPENWTSDVQQDYLYCHFLDAQTTQLDMKTLRAEGWDPARALVVNSNRRPNEKQQLFEEDALESSLPHNLEGGNNAVLQDFVWIPSKSVNNERPHWTRMPI